MFENLCLKITEKSGKQHAAKVSTEWVEQCPNSNQKKHYVSAVLTVGAFYNLGLILQCNTGYTLQMWDVTKPDAISEYFYNSRVQTRDKLILESSQEELQLLITFVCNNDSYFVGNWVCNYKYGSFFIKKTTTNESAGNYKTN